MQRLLSLHFLLFEQSAGPLQKELPPLVCGFCAHFAQIIICMSRELASFALPPSLRTKLSKAGFSLNQALGENRPTFLTDFFDSGFRTVSDLSDIKAIDLAKGNQFSPFVQHYLPSYFFPCRGINHARRSIECIANHSAQILRCSYISTKDSAGYFAGEREARSYNYILW